MAIRRGRFQPPAAYVASKRNLGMPVLTPYTSGISRASSSAYDTRVEDYLLSDRISDANYLSASTMDMSEDTVKRSRGRDQQLLRDATNAIVSSESYATPQSSVAARRVARGRSVAPRAASVPPRPQYPEVDSVYALKSSATTHQAPPHAYPYRPIVVYASPRREDRAVSVPPKVYFAREDRRKRVQASVPREDWRAAAAAARARSVPPPVLYRAERAKSVPPPRTARSPSPSRRRLYYRGAAARALYARPIHGGGGGPQEPLPTAGLKATRIPRRFLTRGGIRTGFSNLRGYYDHSRKEGERPRVLGSQLARNKSRPYYYPTPPKPKPVSIAVSLSNFPQVYVPPKGRKPSNRSKAAIIASKLEPDPLKRRRPRSEFAANKYRSLKKEAQESIYSGTPRSAGLYAHQPPLPKISERKAIRTEDGYSKPKNLLSWQYRLESRTAPSDLLYQPSAFIRIREQVRDAQERMDRHRQLLDRYLPEGDDSGDPASRVLRKMADMEKRDPVGLRRPRGRRAKESPV